MEKLDDIWIVDDDDIYTRLLKKLIQRQHLATNIAAFPNGRVALDALSERLQSGQGIPELILLDINMPMIDGWGFIEEFETYPVEPLSNTHVYIVSSSIANEDKDRALSYKSVKNYLIKPVDPVALTNMVHQHPSSRN
ncbi:MAG: response regulator [Chitinophagia bacterium]|nr:response regulator [Chitinophagia bacterium]